MPLDLQPVPTPTLASGKQCLLIPAWSVTQVASGRDSVTDIYSTGKSMFFAMIMVVTLEIGLLARYWTWPFVIICFLSYTLVGFGSLSWRPALGSEHTGDFRSSTSRRKVQILRVLLPVGVSFRAAGAAHRAWLRLPRRHTTGRGKLFCFRLAYLDNRELKRRFDVLGLLVSVQCGWVGRDRQHVSSAARGSMQAWLS